MENLSHVQERVPSILVVDDEEDLRVAIEFEMKRSGFEVHGAPGGRPAFELMKRTRVDLVVSDIRMADGDGIELLKNIKLLDPWKPVVIFITAFADLTIEDAYDLGVDAIFSKPFGRKELVAAIRRSLLPIRERWRAREASAELEVDFESARLGRGGAFLASPTVTLTADRVFRFRAPMLDSAQLRSAQLVSGRAVVRWVRGRGEAGSRGIGAEFLELDASCLDEVARRLEAAAPKAFIPAARSEAH